MNLGGANIGAERPVDFVLDVHCACLADLARMRAPLLHIRIFLGHMRKGPIEHGKLMLHHKADIGVMLQRLVERGMPIRCFERNRLLAILVLNPHAAVVSVMPDIAAPEVDKASLDLLLVGDEFHFPCPTVQNLCRLLP